MEVSFELGLVVHGDASTQAAHDAHDTAASAHAAPEPKRPKSDIRSFFKSIGSV